MFPNGPEARFLSHQIKTLCFFLWMLLESNLLGLNMINIEKHSVTLQGVPWSKYLRVHGSNGPSPSYCSTIFQTVPKAAVCFLVFPLRCVFAPLNPAFTVPEIEFEFQDLPCHTVVVMDGEDNTATLQVGEVAKYTIVNLILDMFGLWTCQKMRKSMNILSEAARLCPFIGRTLWTYQGRNRTEGPSVGDAAAF